jgi:hypothetical protein
MNYRNPILATLLSSAALFACGGPEEGGAADKASEGQGSATTHDALSGAGSCASFLATHFTASQTGNWVTFRLVSHNPNTKQVTYVDSYFDVYTAARSTLFCSINGFCTPYTWPATLGQSSAFADQIFSDRTFARSQWVWNMFDVTLPDLVSVSLSDQGKITITKPTGNVTVTNVECLQGNLYGVGNDGNLYSMSLYDEYL